MTRDTEASSPALLTRREQDWLSGKTGRISRSYEYKLKSLIKKKIQTFVDHELPLLIKNNLLISYGQKSLGMGLRDKSNFDNSSLGKAKVPGPNPGQGLPIIVKEGKNEEFDISEILQPAVRTLQYTVRSPRQFHYDTNHGVTMAFDRINKLTRATVLC